MPCEKKGGSNHDFMPRKPDKNLISIGGRLRRIREARGKNMTIAHEIRDLYDVKIDPSYLSRMERGKVEIPLRTLFALADYYQISAGLLIDPGIRGNATGVEFLFSDRLLMQNILRARELLGKNETAAHLRIFLGQILSILDERPEESKKLRAARPVNGDRTLDVGKKKKSALETGEKEEEDSESFPYEDKALIDILLEEEQEETEETEENSRMERADQDANE